MQNELVNGFNDADQKALEMALHFGRSDEDE